MEDETRLLHIPLFFLLNFAVLGMWVLDIFVGTVCTNADRLYVSMNKLD